MKSAIGSTIGYWRLAICLLAAVLLQPPRAHAVDQIIEATITVTNFSGINTNGTCTLVINGDTRTATNIISANPSIYFYGTNSMLPGKTNLYNHISLYPFGAGLGRLTLINIGTNSFKLRSAVNQPLAGTVNGLWGTISFSTITITNFTPVTVPREYYTAPEATNIAAEVARLLDLSSNAISAASIALSNYANLYGQQTLSNKVFQSSTNRGGALENFQKASGTNAAFTNVVLVFVDITGVTNLAGYIRALTNGYLTNVVIETDATNRFGKVNIPSGGGIKIGSTNQQATFAGGLEAVGQTPIVYLNGFSDTPLNKPILLLQRARGGEGNPTNALAGDTIGWIDLLPRGLTLYRAGLHITAEARGDITDTSSAILGTISVGKTNSGSQYQLVFGFTATDVTNNVAAWFNSNLTAVAMAYFADLRAAGGILTNIVIYSSTNWSTNLFAFAGSVSNLLFQNGSLSNVVFLAGSTNVFPAGSDISFGRSTVTTVAAGHNTINVGTNVYVDLTGSPTAAWTWGGITGGNRDGKLLFVVNNTGYAADIIHNSGTEPTASLRITTPTGTNVTVNNAGSAIFIYNPSTTRWILLNVFNTATPAASATNALATLATNGVLVTSALTNLNLIYGPGMDARTTNTSGRVDLELRPKLRQLFNLTTSITVTNTTSPTSLITNGLTAPQIIPANSVTTNTVMHVVASGQFTSASAAMTEIGIRFNNGLVIATNLLALGTTLVGDMWTLDCNIQCRATGASGSVMGIGWIAVPSSTGAAASLAPKRLQKGVQPTTTTVDFSVDEVFDVYITPGATTHGFTTTLCYVEFLQ